MEPVNDKDSKDILENMNLNNVSQMDIDEMYELMEKIQIDKIESKSEYSEEEVDSIFNEINNSTSNTSNDTENTFLSISNNYIISLNCENSKNKFESISELEDYIKTYAKFDGTFYRFVLNKKTHNLCLVLRSLSRLIEIIKEKHICYVKN